MTQTGANPKKEVITEWTPRGSLNEDVVFRATVAKTFAVFWTEIDSKPVRMRSEGLPSEQMVGINIVIPRIYEQSRTFNSACSLLGLLM